MSCLSTDIPEQNKRARANDPGGSYRGYRKTQACSPGVPMYVCTTPPFINVFFTYRGYRKTQACSPGVPTYVCTTPPFINVFFTYRGYRKTQACSPGVLTCAVCVCVCACACVYVCVCVCVFMNFILIHYFNLFFLSSRCSYGRTGPWVFYYDSFF
jgi:hypothetical protein